MCDHMDVRRAHRRSKFLWSSIFVGYFPKKTSPYQEWLGTPAVKEICSVSNCFSKAPLNWIDHWTHNKVTWFYDAEDIAWSIVETSRADYDMYAYKGYPWFLDRLAERPWQIEGVPEHLQNYEFLGFDIVTREPEIIGWGHSPLSCNVGCREFKVNSFCLINDFENALACIMKMAADLADPRYHNKWEFGLLHLFEVYRKIR